MIWINFQKRGECCKVIYEGLSDNKHSILAAMCNVLFSPSHANHVGLCLFLLLLQTRETKGC